MKSGILSQRENNMKIKGERTFQSGYNSIVEECTGGMLMDFGILKLSQNQTYKNDEKKEKVFLLLYGEAVFEWDDKKVQAKREDFLDDEVWCLNVPQDIEVKITGAAADTEISVHKTFNEKNFPARVYTKKETVNEIRGKGQMNEAGTRIVRTFMDYSLTPHSNFMIGEDVHYPGKWAGFPSHYHPQPEIYFYKFFPEQGFGLLKLGGEGVLLEHNDTVRINPNLVHPQVAAPGYAMYFLWVIRHLDGNPYIRPVFEPEHLWVEKKDAKIWPDK